ncbi:MAG: hypothetical protein ACRYGR_07010 [Janthinobacterium lividum]
MSKVLSTLDGFHRDFDESYHEYIETGQNVGTLAFLLHHLPTLNHLTLGVSESRYVAMIAKDAPAHWKAERHVVETKMPLHVQIGHQSSESEVASYSSRGHSRSSGRLSAAVALSRSVMPSVESITVYRLHATGNNTSMSDLLAAQSSMVRGLSFKGCIVGSETLHDFIRCFENLRSFTYDTSAFDADTNDQYKLNDEMRDLLDVDGIRDSLEYFAKNYLESLTLRVRQYSEVNRDLFYLGSLMNFTNLSYLDTDVYCLFKSSLDDIKETTTLAEILPNTIKHLRLHDQQNGISPRILDMILFIAKNKEESLPRLEKADVWSSDADFYFRDYARAWELADHWRIRKHCKRAGFDFNLIYPKYEDESDDETESEYENESDQ